MKTIALAGKGGTGKTTLAALLIRALLRAGATPVLAIDADPATNLHLALGLQMPVTVGDVREEMLQAAQAHQLGVAISRHDYLRQEVRLALEEGEAVDLLAMGRPEGQGCYCAVNHLLRQVVDELGRSYAYVVIDNEAGMEHISRRTTQDVDLLLVVSDPTVRGLKTAAGIGQLAKDVEVNVKNTLLVINRVQGALPEALQQAVHESALPLASLIPADDQVNQLDALGQPLIWLDGESAAGRAIDALAERILSTI
ncbi:MAG: AAA family ATPase [Anaerolineales bacterium]|nr:AAA family ATPase [Anaerolineales bacterium]